MNSGAFALDNRFVRFGFPGCPDILGQLKDGRILAIECKAAKGRLTAAQARFLARVGDNRGVGGMVRSIDDARALLEAA